MLVVSAISSVVLLEHQITISHDEQAVDVTVGSTIYPIRKVGEQRFIEMLSFLCGYCPFADFGSCRDVVAGYQDTPAYQETPSQDSIEDLSFHFDHSNCLPRWCICFSMQEGVRKLRCLEGFTHRLRQTYRFFLKCAEETGEPLRSLKPIAKAGIHIVGMSAIALNVVDVVTYCVRACLRVVEPS